MGVEQPALLHRFEFRAEHQVIRRRHRMDQSHIGVLMARLHRAQHRHDRGDAAAGRHEQKLLGEVGGKDELTLRRCEPDHGARCQTPNQVSGEETLGHRLHGDRDHPTTGTSRGLRHRCQRIRTPGPAPLDEYPDPHVLARKVIEREPPPRFDDDGGRVRGLRPDLHDLAAQLTRRPQRIRKVQIVVRQQRGGDPRRHRPHTVGRPVAAGDAPHGCLETFSPTHLIASIQLPPSILGRKLTQP